MMIDARRHSMKNIKIFVPLAVLFLSCFSTFCRADEPAAKSENPQAKTAETQPQAKSECTPLAEPAPEPACPRPADFLSKNQANEYIDEALAFIKTYPHSRSVTMVANDVIIVASMLARNDVADDMKRFLLLGHSQDFYTYHLLQTIKSSAGTNGGNSNQECIRLLNELVNNEKYPFRMGFIHDYLAAIQVSMAYFGTSLLDNDELLLDLALFSRVAGQDEQAEVYKKQLLKKEGDAKKIADIALGDWNDKVSILLQLHALKNREMTAIYAEYFASQLTEEQSRLPQVLKAAIEDGLESQQFADALELIEKSFPNSDDPQVLYWRAWCRQTLGNSADAIADLDMIREKFPDSPWKPLTEQMAGRIRAWDATLDQHAQAMLDAISKIREEGIEMLEASAQYRTPEGKAFDFYLATAAKTGYLQGVLSQKEKMIVGYSTKTDECKFYCDGQAQIEVAKQGGFYPDIRFSIDRLGPKHFGIGLDCKTSEYPCTLADFMKNLLETEAFRNKENLREFLEGMQKYGWQPVAVTDGQNEKLYRWVRPKIEKPEVEQWECAVSSDGKISRLSGESFDLSSLHYGRQDSFAWNAPAWPDLPVKQLEEFDWTSMFRVISAVGPLFTSKDNAQLAEKEDSAQR
jgi:tetratricopeptide (TPR) repeat protein